MTSKFLAKVSEAGERAQLRGWVLASVGEMDEILDRGFPGVFGNNWRIKMRNFPTAARTKLLTYVFDHALEKMAQRMGIDYRAANNEGPSETNHFDCYIFGYEVENKLSLGKSTSSFATGSSHNTDNKVDRILVVKIRSEDYKTQAIFAAFVDLSVGGNDSKWHTDGKSGFSTLKVAVADRDIVVPLCGNIRDIRAGTKFIGTEYETFRPQRR